MSEEMIELPMDNYRLFAAIRYWNASYLIVEGMESQCGTNDFYFLITLRSLVEYTRRGIWFLVWATEEELQGAGKMTFDRSGSPGLLRMDEMINEALGLGTVSNLRTPVNGIQEPFINCLHALTHGNPISVRMLAFGLENIFQTRELLLRVKMERDLFTILLCRRMLGEEFDSIWKSISLIYNNPEPMKTAAEIATFRVKQAGLDITGA